MKRIDRTDGHSSVRASINLDNFARRIGWSRFLMNRSDHVMDRSLSRPMSSDVGAAPRQIAYPFPVIILLLIPNRNLTLNLNPHGLLSVTKTIGRQYESKIKIKIRKRNRQAAPAAGRSIAQRGTLSGLSRCSITRNPCRS